jgi:hypothetical protein
MSRPPHPKGGRHAERGRLRRPTRFGAAAAAEAENAMLAGNANAPGLDKITIS